MNQKIPNRSASFTNRIVLATANLCVRTALLLLLVMVAIPTHAASIAPSIPPVVYAEPQEDLRVKALGGSIVIQRTFAEGKWHPNYNWANLQFTYDSFDSSVKTIFRGKAEYAKTAPGVYSFRQRDTLRQTSTGFRWADRSGNWVDFDTQGQIQAYGDKNDIKVTFLYETYATGKRLTGLKDHLDRQVLWYEYTGDQVTAIRDYSNRKVEYRYTNNQLTSVIDTNGNTWAYGYTGSLPTTFTDPENRAITRTWVGNGELASIRYPDGTGTDYKYEYDSSKTLFYKQEKTTGGKVTESWINPEGEVVRQDVNGKSVKTLAADTSARTRTETDPRGLNTTREYDQWDNVTKITYPDNTTVTTTYDPVFSQPTQKTDERGTITKYEYDTKGNLTKLTEAAGLPEQRITEYTYDQYGNRLTEKRLGDANTQEALTQYEYDNYGNVKAIIDPESYRTELSYDAMGNALTKKDARNKIWTKTYDNKGNLKTASDPLNHTTTTVYDKAGRRTKLIDDAANETSYGYDARNNLITVTDPYGGVITYAYNADNQQTGQTDQDNKTQTAEYDLDGRLTKQSDGNGNAIQYVYGDAASGLNSLLIKVIYPTFAQEYKYDNRGRLTETLDLLDATTFYTTKITYDTAGNRASTTDKENKTTRYTYDAINRLTKVTDPANGITEYTHDNRDNLLTLRDPKNQTHRFEYDRRSLKTKETRPLTQAIGYIYDPTGQLETLTDPKGQVKKYAYDDTGRRVGESHYLTASDAAANTNVVKTITYAYNDLNQPTDYNDGATQGTTRYDARNLRKTGETVNYGLFNLSYSYDYSANGLKKSFTGPDGVTVNYSYDSNNQLSGITLPTGTLTVNSYQWTAPAQITLPGGTTRTQAYDPLLRPKTIQVKDPGQNEVMNYRYTYDKADNITQKATEHGTYDYAYDNLYRLTQATNPSPLNQETYTYDAVGNRTTDTNAPGALSYNANNQLTAYGAIILGYDANGNMITKTEGTNITTYVYDTTDRLIEVKTTDTSTNTTTTVATYVYDPYGRRLWKEVNNQKTHFLYADEGLIAEANASGTITTAYGYRPSSTWGTDPLYLKQGTNYYFFQNDHLGTSQKLVAQDGATVWSAKAQAFGQTMVDTASTVTNNLRFPGQYYDPETGLHYNWNRYYDPKIGRYSIEDPSGLKADLNLFRYAYDNPMHYFDPDGLCPCPGGDWKEEFGDFGFSVGFGGVFSAQNVNYSCKSKPWITAKGKQVCIGGGAIATVGIGWTIGGAAGGANSCQALSGWGGWNVMIAGGPVSATFGKGGGNTSVGPGLGAGVAAVRCITYQVKCSNNCGCQVQ